MADTEDAPMLDSTMYGQDDAEMSVVESDWQNALTPMQEDSGTGEVQEYDMAELVDGDGHDIYAADVSFEEAPRMSPAVDGNAPSAPVAPPPVVIVPPTPPAVGSYEPESHEEPILATDPAAQQAQSPVIHGSVEIQLPTHTPADDPEVPQPHSVESYPNQPEITKTNEEVNNHFDNQTEEPVGSDNGDAPDTHAEPTLDAAADAVPAPPEADEPEYEQEQEDQDENENENENENEQHEPEENPISLVEPAEEVSASPPPPVLLSYPPHTFAMFRSPDEAPPSAELLFENHPHLFSQPLSELFIALRVDSHFRHFADHSEIAISIEGLDLTISEDNIHALEVSIADIYRLYIGCEFAEPMTIRMDLVSPRFISRYRAIEAELRKVSTQAEPNGYDETTAVDAPSLPNDPAEPHSEALDLHDEHVEESEFPTEQQAQAESDPDFQKPDSSVTNDGVIPEYETNEDADNESISQHPKVSELTLENPGNSVGEQHLSSDGSSRRDDLEDAAHENPTQHNGNTDSHSASGNYEEVSGDGDTQSGSVAILAAQPTTDQDDISRRSPVSPTNLPLPTSPDSTIEPTAQPHAVDDISTSITADDKIANPDVSEASEEVLPYEDEYAEYYDDEVGDEVATLDDEHSPVDQHSNEVVQSDPRIHVTPKRSFDHIDGEDEAHEPQGDQERRFVEKRIRVE